MSQARDEAGNIWEVDAQGNAVRLISRAGGNGGILRDPKAQYAAPAAEANLRRDQVQAEYARPRAEVDLSQARISQANTALQNQRLQGEIPYAGRNAAASATKSEIDNPQALRKEYESKPEVKSYRISTQMADVALRTAANPQGDLALTYAFAKAMDPDSVVREGEQSMASNTQPWLQRAAEAVKKQFGMSGAGSFSPQARSLLRQEVLQALATRKPLYDARRAEMSDYAAKYGIDPYEVVGKSDAEIYAPSFRKYAEQNGDDTGAISQIIGGEPIVRQGAAQAGAGSPASPGLAGFGATEGSTPIPAEMQAAHEAYLKDNWGKLDARDYAAFRVNLDSKYGFGSNADAYRAAAPNLNEYAQKGGQPSAAAIPGVKKELSGLDQFRNNVVANPVGAAVASAANAATLGVPGLLAREQTDALREAYPISSFAGDIGGGLVGTGVAGAGLKSIAGRIGSGGVASALATPLAADLAYGGVYGATQADDPLYGAAGGVAAALLGNRVGKVIGKAFPSATGMGGAIREADRAVPTSDELRQTASGLYQKAEANGLTAGPDETLALADTTSGLLSREGRMSPTGRLTEVQPKVKEAYGLIQDYADQPMTPTQVQTVRSVISDGLGSQEPSERRIARLLLNNFDQWTDATNPDLASGLADARSVASRYLQGDKIAQARELADVRAGQFSNSGAGNALRTDFRQLDRSIAKGDESFAPDVVNQIADVARGNPVSNALRFVGKFAPTGPVAAVPTIAAMAGGGSAVGPLGAVGGALLGAGAYGARQLGQGLTERSAQVAQNMAYGGPEYSATIAQLLMEAGDRGGTAGAVLLDNASQRVPDWARIRQ